MSSHIYERRPEGGLQQWRRVGVRELTVPATGTPAGEDYLEEAIAECPTLLGFGSSEDTSRVHGPFVCFQQVQLTALNGRTVAPDIIILSGSGDVIVVEVKLGDNAELRDRRVVGQVLEYAASLADASEEDLIRMFGRGDTASGSWQELVGELFGDQAKSGRLASQFVARLRARALHLVIACDRVPRGLRELVEGVIGQEALGDYDFRVVEVSAFAAPSHASVLLMPHVRIQTEIVSRTAVSVEVRGPSESPHVKVEVTPFGEAEAADREAKRRAGAIGWDEESFFTAVEGLDKPTREAFRVAYDHFDANSSLDIGFGNGAKYGTVRIRANGMDVAQLETNGKFWVQFNYVSPETAEGMRRILDEVAGIDLPEGEYRGLRPEVWVPKLPVLLKAYDEIVASLDELRH